MPILMAALSPDPAAIINIAQNAFIYSAKPARLYQIR